MPRSVLVVCGVLVLLGSAWWWGQQPESAPPVSVASQPAALLPAAPMAAAVGDSEPAERREATETTAAPPIPDGATWVEMLVVDAASDSPVADVEICYYDETCYARAQSLPAAESAALFNDQECIARQFGWRTRSDASGKARVHFATQYAVAYGRDDGRFGQVLCSANAPPGGYQLVLADDRTLRVQVLDAASSPAANVPVGIRGKKQHASLALARSRTGSDGIASFRHLQRLRPGAMDAKGPFRVCLGTPGIDDDGIEVDLSTPPAEPIVLHLPPTGELALRVVHAGAPLSKQPAIGIYVGARDDWSKRNSGLNGAPAADGWVHLLHLPLGCTFEAYAEVDSLHLKEAIAGPVLPGERVDAELRVPDDAVIVTGRLLDAAGTVVAGRQLRMELRTDTTGRQGPVALDVEGRFAVFVPGRAGQNIRLELLVFTQILDRGSLRAEVSSRDLQPGTNDLGDLRLTTAPLVVGGRFLADRPIREGELRFEVQGYDPRPRHREPWERIDGFVQSVQEDGRFEVRGTVPSGSSGSSGSAGRFRLVFPAHAHLPLPPIEFVPGTDNLQIPIAFGDGLEASCLVPEGIAGRQLRAVLRPSAAAPPLVEPPGQGFHTFFRSERFVVEPTDTGKRVQIRWRALPADIYTFELLAAGFAEPFVRIENVRVPPLDGGDARLVDIDLRPVMRPLLVHVTLPAAVTVDARGAVVFPMPQPEGQSRCGYPVQAGELCMPAPRGPIDLLVACAGLRPQLVRGVDREATVSLEPWPQVELTFVGLPMLPEGFEFTAGSSGQARQPEGHYETWRNYSGIDTLLAPDTKGQVVHDGRVRVLLGDGPNQVLLWLHDAASGIGLPVRSLTPVDIPDGVRALAVQVSAAEIEAVIAKLRAMPGRKG